MIINHHKNNTTITHLTSNRKNTLHFSRRHFAVECSLFLIGYLLCYTVMSNPTTTTTTPTVYQSLNEQLKKMNVELQDMGSQVTQLEKFTNTLENKLLANEFVAEVQPIIAEKYEMMFAYNINFALFCLIANVFLIQYFYYKFKQHSKQ